MNRDRISCYDATRYGAGDLKDTLPRFRNTPVPNWEGPKLDSASFAKITFALAAQARRPRPVREGLRPDLDYRSSTRRFHPPANRQLEAEPRRLSARLWPAQPKTIGTSLNLSAAVYHLATILLSLRAKRSNPGPRSQLWIASSLSLLAMTARRCSYPLTPIFLSTKQAPPARRMGLQRSSASGLVSAPMRTW